MPHRRSVMGRTRQQAMHFLLQRCLIMQAQPLELRAPEWAIRSDRTTGATPLEPMSTSQLTGTSMFLPWLWRRQNSRRLSEANDLRMRPEG